MCDLTDTHLTGLAVAVVHDSAARTPPGSGGQSPPHDALSDRVRRAVRDDREHERGPYAEQRMLSYEHLGVDLPGAHTDHP